MANILHILSADVIAHGILKIIWDDNYAGLVDLRPIIARSEAFVPLQDPEYFKTVHVAAYGHSIYWGAGDGTVDFGCHRLRELASELGPIPSRHH